MGRSTSTTKSGKFMNPTDQASKSILLLIYSIICFHVHTTTLNKHTMLYFRISNSSSIVKRQILNNFSVLRKLYSLIIPLATITC